MKKFLKTTMLTAALTFGAVALAGCNDSSEVQPDIFGSSSVGSGTVLATNRGITVYSQDFLYFFRNYLNQEEMSLRMMGMDDEEIANFFAQEMMPGQTLTDMISEQAMTDAIEQAILVHLATDAGFTYDEEIFTQMMNEMNSILESMAAEAGQTPDEVFYEMFGVDLAAAADIQRNMLIISAFIDGKADTIQVSEADVQNFVNENRITFERELGLEAHVAHVLVEDEALAEEILARLNAGEDVADLARDYSVDPGSNMTGGDYEFPRGMMVPSFEDWAFNANPGDTGIVPSDFGFHVMYAIGRQHLEDHLDITIAMEQYRAARAMEQITEMLEEFRANWDINYDILENLF